MPPALQLDKKISRRRLVPFLQDSRILYSPTFGAQLYDCEVLFSLAANSPFDVDNEQDYELIERTLDTLEGQRFSAWLLEPDITWYSLRKLYFKTLGFPTARSGILR